MKVYVITQACIDAAFVDAFVGIVFSTKQGAIHYIRSNQPLESEKFYFVEVEVDKIY